jgi:PhnB protein
MPISRALSLVPLLVVRDASSAIDFYVRALGAREEVRYLDSRRGMVSHADLVIGEAVFSVTEEARAWSSDAPPSLGGSPVVLQLNVESVGAAFETMCAAGATVVFPVVEFCGERMARLRDPYGHLWLLIQRIEELSPDEIQRRRDAWTPPQAAPEDLTRLCGGHPAMQAEEPRGVNSATRRAA